MDITDQIIKLIDELAKRFGIAIDWSSNEILPYIQEIMEKYINYEIANSIVLVLIGIIGFIIALVCFKNAKRFYDDAGYEDIEMMFSIMLIIVGAILIIISPIVFIYNVQKVIRCIFIPELQVFEYIKSIKI